MKPAAIRKLIYAAENSRDRCLLATLATTGMRRAEAAALDVRDVDLKRRRLTIRHGKGRKDRIVPISTELASDLKFLVKGRSRGPVFPGRRLRRHGREVMPLTIRQINRIVAEAGERAGVTHPDPKKQAITPHLLRHSFARTWKARGGNIESLADILGHASTATTLDLYGTPSLDDTQEAYDRIMDEPESE